MKREVSSGPCLFLCARDRWTETKQTHWLWGWTPRGSMWRVTKTVTLINPT
jgi:hypothetical protein